MYIINKSETTTQKIDNLLKFRRYNNIFSRKLANQFALENYGSSSGLKYSTTTPENPIVIDDDVKPKAKATNLTPERKKIDYKRAFSSSLSLSFSPENKSPSYCPLEEISPPSSFDDMSNVSSQSNKSKNEANPAIKTTLCYKL